MSSFFGKLIMDMRQERMMSIDELAERSGVSADEIASIENGTAGASFSSFIRLIRSLGTSPVHGIRKTSKVCVSYAKDAKQLKQPEGMMDCVPLTKGVGDRHMAPFIINLYDTGWSEIDSERDGEDFIYVLSGTIQIQHGDKKYHLLAGDSIYYDSTVPHSVKNLDSEGSRLLIVLY